MTKKRGFARLSDIDDAYATPDEFETDEACKRRITNKRKAISRWRIQQNESQQNPQEKEPARNRERNAARRERLTPEELEAERARHASQVAARRSEITAQELHMIQARNTAQHAFRRRAMPIEDSRCLRENNRAQHTTRRSRGAGSKLCALSSIDTYQHPVDRHSIEEMDRECMHCHALTWKDEASSTCCLEGRVIFAPTNDPPSFLKKFVATPSLLRQIRAYNNVFAFTSMGASVRDNIGIDTNYANGQQGVYTFRVQGTICHCIGTLLPEEGSSSTFAQVYVYDGDMEHQVDKRMSIMDGLDRPTVKALQRKLVASNPYVKKFLTAGEKSRRGVNLHLVIHEEPGTDLRTHNRPTADEVAVIIVDEDSAKERDIVLSRRGGGLK